MSNVLGGCNSNQKVKVYALDRMGCIDKGNDYPIVENLASFGYRPITNLYGLTDGNQIQFTVYGKEVLTKFFVWQVCDENGEQIAPDGSLVTFKAYWDSEGFGQSFGGGMTEEQVQALIAAAISPLQLRVTLLEARVTVLEENAGYTQLDTPTPTVSNVTYNSATAAWPAVTNSDSYDVYLNGELLGNATALTYPLTGLDESTPYSVGVVAVGTLPYLDSEAGEYDFNTPAQGGGGGNINVFPLTFPFQFAS
jgi:hypothetical protein